MSTHITRCTVCESPVSCTSDSYVLTVTGFCGYALDGAPIAFCSSFCFRWLQEAMLKRSEIANELSREDLSIRRMLDNNTLPAARDIPDDAFSQWPGVTVAYVAPVGWGEGIVLRARHIIGEGVPDFIEWLKTQGLPR